MNTDILLDVPVQLSPRLAWMQKHGVISRMANISALVDGDLNPEAKF